MSEFFNACKPCYGCYIDDKTGDVYVDGYAIHRDRVWRELNKAIENAQYNYARTHPNDYLQLGGKFAVGLIHSLKEEAIKNPDDRDMMRAIMAILIEGAAKGYYSGVVNPKYDVNKRLEIY